MHFTGTGFYLTQGTVAKFSGLGNQAGSLCLPQIRAGKSDSRPARRNLAQFAKIIQPSGTQGDADREVK